MYMTVTLMCHLRMLFVKIMFKPNLEEIFEIVGEAASKLVPEMSLIVHSSQARANLTDKDFHARQAELRNLAVDKWLCIVRRHTLSSHVGQLILSQCNLNQIDEAREIVSAVIGTTRSSTTAISRANAVLKYLRWSNEREEVLDPQAETTAWEYVKFLKSSGAAATVGSTWISSIRYAVFVFGYKQLHAVVDSRRVVGQCDVMYNVCGQGHLEASRAFHCLPSQRDAWHA